MTQAMKSLSDYDYREWKNKRAIIGYMDLTDWDHHLGEDSAGSKVYPGIDDCIKDNKCIDECGIIKVEIRAVEVIQERNESNS